MRHLPFSKVSDRISRIVHHARDGGHRGIEIISALAFLDVLIVLTRDHQVYPDLVVGRRSACHEARARWGALRAQRVEIGEQDTFVS